VVELGLGLGTITGHRLRIKGGEEARKKGKGNWRKVSKMLREGVSPWSKRAVAISSMICV